MSDNNNNNVNNNSGNQTPHFDNLKAKLASKAATAVGGPAAGKAVDTINKIRNNPNNSGYANNKINRLGQAGNTSNDNSSGLDENSSNGTTNTAQSNSVNPLKKIGSVFGGNKNKTKTNDFTAAKAFKAIKKIKMIAPIIAALSPFIMSFLGLIIIVVIVMSQFAAIENFVAEIKVGVEKILNFTSGDGWVTNETAFFTRLREENEKYQQLSYNNENLDLPLIAATIHYDRLVDIDVYEEEQIDNKEYNSAAQDSAIVRKENTAAFYGVAEKMLGKVDTVVPGDRMLLGHLVKTKIRYTKFDDDDDALAAWGNYFKQAGISISEELCFPNPLDIRCYAKKSSDFIQNISNFKEKYDDILAYDDFKRLNVAYEIEEFLSGFSTDEELKEEQKQSGNWVPVVTREMDYETYKNYLRNVYIPFNYYFGAKKEDVDPLEVEKIVNEIFAQRDYYNYLFHNENEDGDGEICTCTSNLSNIKVKLYSCGSGHTGVEQYYVETVSFDDYIKGVILAEEGGVITNKSNEEFVKAFILTAKSYTLGRGVRYMNPSYFDLNSPVIEVELQNCSNDQNYKSYTNATSRQKEVIERLYSEVSNQILVTSADSTRVKQAGYMNNAAHACGSHDCSEGNGSIMNVTEAAKLSQQGYTYDEILKYYYGSKYAIKSIENDCKSTNVDIGEWANWKQGGSSWSGIVIGHYKDKNGKVHSSTVGGIGCFITSYSIQMARTGLFGSDFNPGVFANKTLQTSCYSYGGGFRGGACFKNAFPAVSKVEGKTYSGNNLQEMASKMKDDIVNNNCYLTLRVKYGKNKNGDEQQHWVAVAGIDNSNNILIVDPAGTKEKGIHVLDNKYCSKAGYNVCKQTSVTARCMLFDGVSGVNITSDKTQSIDKTKSSGDWENWRQFDEDWGNVEIVKGHPELSLTKQGCLLTSYAIQMARSGTVSKDFNPGNFTTTLRDNGAFGGSKDIIDPDILKNKYPQVSDSYSKTYTYNGLNDLGKQIKTDINNGCYVTLQSKYNSDHFIAVVDVDSNNNITIVDPASGKSGKTTLNANYCKVRNQHICDRTSVNAYCLKINGGNSDNSLSKCSYSHKKSSGATCNGKFCFPLPYPTYNNEGYYCKMKFENGRYHEGSDYGAHEGTSIYAYKAGTVKYVRYDDKDPDGRGTYIILEHDCSDGTACYTLYGHMVLNSNNHLKVGDKVEAGAIIGKVGQTGNATGSHLHVEFWDKYEPHKAYYDPVQEMVNVGFTINEKNKNKPNKVNNVKTASKSSNSKTSSSPTPQSINASGDAKCIGNYCFPVKYGTKITSPYGQRWGRTHKGIDLGAGKGTNIYAYKSGKVVKVIYTGYGGGYGTHVILQHDCGDGKACYSLYAHMIANSNKKLKVGDKVKAGAVIGKVGNTGHSFGAHLHFEMWKKYSYSAHYNPASELKSIGFALKY